MNIRDNLWPLLLLVIAFGVFCISMPLIIWRGALPTELFLQVASLIISWPVAVTVLGLIFLGRFREAIDHMLRNIGTMKLPGGIEFQSQQHSTPAPPPPPPAGTVTLTPEQSQQLATFIGDLEQRRQLSEAEKAQLKTLYEQALNQAVAWKFQYLNLFFVPTTKQILFWLSRVPPQTREQFHATWQVVIPDATQRQTILDVLLQNGMAAEAGGTISITPGGHMFLQYLGFVPYGAPGAGRPGT